ncbi:hypothetical protein STSP2_00617 [Anaerohalosphaera lusitana]|uniref:Uncharacterized protein n=1 Tax=Anaerohalosphaera lusitana TaxID=1936003 RepID=A0A1U9NIP9_9BACT|nr:hypothetical protein STSP2_00617 [Anaerohalosphaera lusitana]
MPQKTKAACSIVITIAGWGIFFASLIYRNTAPIQNEFSSLANYAVSFYGIIIASVVQLISFICSICFLQKPACRKTSAITIISTLVFAIYISVAFYHHWI